jgi:hypothetical protein
VGLATVTIPFHQSSTAGFGDRLQADRSVHDPHIADHVLQVEGDPRVRRLELDLFTRHGERAEQHLTRLGLLLPHGGALQGRLSVAPSALFGDLAGLGQIVHVLALSILEHLRVALRHIPRMDGATTQVGEATPDFDESVGLINVLLSELHRRTQGQAEQFGGGLLYGLFGRASAGGLHETVPVLGDDATRLRRPQALVVQGCFGVDDGACRGHGLVTAVTQELA